jgi:IstB-like ATP binding protein
MSILTCACGAKFEREVPVGLTEPWLSKLKAWAACPACSEQQVTELAEDKATREAHAREEQLRLEARAVSARRRRSGIPKMLCGLGWEDVADNGLDVLGAAQAWGIGDLLGLLLTGAVGRGKTWLAAAAANARLELGPVCWFSTPALLAQLGLSFGDDRREALEALAGSTALVLDDIDKARPSEYAAERLFLAIDSRLTSGAPLLVTTNLGLDALAARFPDPVGDAIVSRLAGYCEAFVLQGHDRRLERFAS